RCVRLRTFFFSSRRRHTRSKRDWSSDVCSSDLPDLGPLHKASETVGSILQKGMIVVYESTVFPGATEEECLPILEAHSGLTGGVDFHIAYSPERINPGDEVNTFENIIKVVSGQTDEVRSIVAEVRSEERRVGNK